MNPELPLSELLKLMDGLGCTALLCKPLAQNDNTKNQIYLGPDLTGLNVLPYGEVAAFGVGEKANLKAKLDLFWINEELQYSNAPGAQLILYPQYPEVRLSGVLRGCHTAPSALMRARGAGYEIPKRFLLLGVNQTERALFGFIAVDGTAIFHTLKDSLAGRDPKGIFFDLTGLLPLPDSRTALLQTLREIASRGWITSKRLDRSGMVLPCTAPNCGGLTLEAELGIRPNSRSEPDYLGWEIKQHGVAKLDDLPKRLKLKGSPITLMTPEPKAGLYVDLGVEKFIRRFGYEDRTGRLDRLNFGGKYVCNKPYPLTGLMLMLEGFEHTSGNWLPNGRLLLVTPGTLEPAAVWPLAELLQHWGRKHAKAAYVPSIFQRTPSLEFRFGGYVRLGEGPDFKLFLRAVSDGLVYYDPGIKLENISADPKLKRRSQFRILSGDLPHIYESMTTEALF